MAYDAASGYFLCIGRYPGQVHNVHVRDVFN